MQQLIVIIALKYYSVEKSCRIRWKNIQLQSK